MKTLAIVVLAISAAVPAAAQTSEPAADVGAAMQAPWGVQIAGSYSKAQAMADFTELQRRFSAILTTRPPMIFTGRMAGGGQGRFYQVRVPADTRDEAEDICEKLKAAGGACVVVKS